MVLGVLGFVWGFAEATLFFVVADVIISLAGLLRGWRAGLATALWSTLGAVLGGGVLHRWADRSPDAALGAVERVPAVSPEMIADLHEQMRTGVQRESQTGLLAVLMRASTRGVPYKIAAASAPGLGISLRRFIWITPPARFPRFMAAAAGGAILAKVARPQRGAVTALIGFWCIFYTWFWGRSARRS